tara:strand:+ start:617 stop:811 length:195 start_codon:yes stop_codon:yes gene_type:complete
MQAINKAWDILSDLSTRQKYDDAIRDKQPESDAFDEKNIAKMKTMAAMITLSGIGTSLFRTTLI